MYQAEVVVAEMSSSNSDYMVSPRYTDTISWLASDCSQLHNARDRV